MIFCVIFVQLFHYIILFFWDLFLIECGKCVGFIGQWKMD